MSGKGRPILMGTAIHISLIPEAVEKMLAVDGLYIATDTTDELKGEAPLVVMDGKVFSMKIDKELDPTRFIATARLAGPFRGEGRGQ